MRHADTHNKTSSLYHGNLCYNQKQLEDFRGALLSMIAKTTRKVWIMCFEFGTNIGYRSN